MPHISIPAGVLVCSLLTPNGHARSLNEVLAETMLVRAVVNESVENEYKQLVSKQVVQHVYCGDIAIGAEFIDGSTATGQDWHGVAVFPPLEVGHEGIWLLRRLADGSPARAATRLDIRWPVRRDVAETIGPIHQTPEQGIEASNAHYERVLQLALALEEVWHEDSEADRIDLLEHYAASDTPEVSVGCILLLEQGAPHALTHFAHDQNLQAFPVRAQIALDEAMVRVQPEWQRSDKREQLLKSWQQQVSVDETNALAILTRLDQAIQRKEIDPKQFFEFLEGFASAGDASSEICLRAVSMLRWIASDPEVGGKVSDLLAGILEKGGSSRLEQTAAYAISPVEKLTDERMAKLILLRDAYQEKALQIEDKRDPVKRIAATLDETVRRLQTPKRPG